MRKISLSNGQYALVDDEDYEKLSQYKWHVNKNGYIQRSIYLGGGRKNKKYKGEKLHHLILIPKHDEGLYIDHINRNKLDNRKENLRYCTHAENCRNRQVRADNKTGVKGVNKMHNCNRWRVRIQVNGKRKHIGLFEKLEDAMEAYKNASMKYHQEYGQV